MWKFSKKIAFRFLFLLKKTKKKFYMLRRKLKFFRYVHQNFSSDVRKIILEYNNIDFNKDISLNKLSLLDSAYMLLETKHLDALKIAVSKNDFEFVQVLQEKIETLKKVKGVDFP